LRRRLDGRRKVSIVQPPETSLGAGEQISATASICASGSFQLTQRSSRCVSEGTIP